METDRETAFSLTASNKDTKPIIIMAPTTALIYLYFLRCPPTKHSHAGGVRTLSCDHRETPTFNP